MAKRNPKRMETATTRKILIWDCEMAGVQGLKADRAFICCFGWKWLGSPKTNVITLLDYPGKNCQDDTKLLKAAWAVLSEADLLVAHFGDKFDKPFIRARFAHAGIPNFPMVRQVDTCLISREIFCLSSNRLSNLAEFLGCENKKMEKGRGWPDWWMGVLRGDASSLKNMAFYCAQDVRALEDVYVRMKPYIPARYLIDESMGNKALSPCCGSPIVFRGQYYAARKIYQRFQCKKCYKADHFASALKVQ